MEGEIQTERAAPDTPSARFGDELFNILGRSRDGHRLRGIEGGNLRRTADLGEKVARLLAAQRQRRHSPVAIGALLAAAAGDDNPCRVGKRQCIGAPRGSDFADAMSEVSAGDNAIRTQCTDNADLDRKKQRLSDVGASKRRCLHPVLYPSNNRPAKLGAEEAIDSFDSGAKRVTRAQRRLPHPGILRAIAGEDKREPGANDSGPS